MTIEDNIKDEKLLCDINRETAKISALLSGKIHKYKDVTDEEILPDDQSRMVEQARFNYSPFRKCFENQTKAIEHQKKKQVEALKVLKRAEHQQKPESIEDVFPKEQENNYIKNELDEIEKSKEKIIEMV